MSDSTVKPVVFVAFANDQNDQVSYLRNLPEEARQIREPIQRARRDELCEYIELANATAADIFRIFQDPEYRDRIAVFHYGGHANGYQLLLESSDGQPAAADAGGFASFIGQQNGLQLVFLNGCSTQNQVSGLLNANVPSVIATSRAIDDQVAMNFARQFYQGLAGGASIRTSYNEAVASIQTAKGDNTRGLYFEGTDEQKQNGADADRLPWDLFLKEGAETVADWNLPLAAGDPLFGLPPLPDHDLPATPFRHLSWFDSEHAEVFFGRGHQIRDMYETLTRPKSAPIVLLYGQSGVGKSSILAAGLIPRLESSHEVCYVRRDQELGLLGSVKKALQPAKRIAPLNESIHFAEDWSDVERQSSEPLVLIVDQLEECFTRPNPDLPQELDEFFNEIQAILGRSADRPQGRLILGFRKEWLAEMESRLQDRRLPRTKVFLERLGRLGIIEAILGPTRSERLQVQYGLRSEPGLAEMMADDLLKDQESAIAPTLQILLTKMWSHATVANQSHPCFDRDLYLQLKRDGILLQDFLDQQFDQIREWRPDVVESGLALDVLSLHTTQLGTAARLDAFDLPESYPHRADVLGPLVQKCKDLYLLVDPSQDRGSTEKGTRLSHDTLAPLIRARYDDSDKPGQRARRILDNRAVDWEDDKEGAPLDPMDLQTVEQGSEGSRAMSDTEERLLKASREERDKRLWVQRISMIAGGIALVVIIGLAFLTAWIQWGKAKKQKELANVQSELAEVQTKRLEESRKLVDYYFTSVSENILLNQPSMKPLRIQLLKKSKDFYDELAKKKLDVPDVSAAVAIAKYNLGRVQMLGNEADGKEAETLFEDARKIQDELYDEKPEDPQIALDLSNTLTEIGNATDNLEDYEKALKIREVLAKDETNQEWPEYQRKLANAYMNIAILLEDRENFDLAKEKYEKMQGTRNRILESRPNLVDEYKFRIYRDLGFGHQNLIGLYQKMDVKLFNEINKEDDGNQKEELKKQRTEARKLVKLNADNAIKQFNIVLEKTSNDSESLYVRASCRLTLALFTSGQERFDFFEQARSELDRIVWANPTVRKYKQELARVYFEWGVAARNPEFLEKAIEQLDSILKDGPDARAAELREWAVDELEKLKQPKNG